MKEVTKEVKLTKDGKRQVVGTVVIPVYESVEELSDHEEPQFIVDQFNKGNKITIMNNERNKHKPATAGKEKRNYIGLSLITTEEFQATNGDPDAIKELVQSDEIQSRIDEYLDSQDDS